MKIQLLVVDDDEPFRHVLIKELSRRGFAVDGAANGRQALEHIEKDACHVVLIDMRMPEMDGLTVLTQIKQISPSTEVIMLTAYADLNDAVEATKRGAFHYLMKPAQLAEVEILIRRAHEKSILEAQNLALREQLERGQAVTELVGESPSMKETREIIRKVSPTDATVLILGESGVGRRLSPTRSTPRVYVLISRLWSSIARFYRRIWLKANSLDTNVGPIPALRARSEDC